LVPISVSPARGSQPFHLSYQFLGFSLAGYHLSHFSPFHLRFWFIFDVLWKILAGYSGRLIHVMFIFEI
jgi:hypothetical protein